MRLPGDYLLPLGPERRVQLAVWKETVFQAGQELEKVAALWESKRRPLDPILTDQHHRPAAVHCRRKSEFVTGIRGHLP